MDSVDSISIVLSVENEVKESWTVIYQFYFGNKDDAFSTGLSL
jgi:hypothetical protein